MSISKAERGWILYDVANSSYSTIMVAVLFPIYFTTICKTHGVSGDFWWGIGNCIATAIVAVCAPMIGAIADIKGIKKKLFNIFLTIGLIFSLFAASSSIWILMLAGFVISRIGFSGTCLINDSFLTDVTTSERMDRISSLAYGFGYIGGSTIPFIMAILLIMFGNKIGINGTQAIQFSVVIMVVWWGLFSIPFIKNVKQIHGLEKPESNYIKDTFVRVGKTFTKIFKNKPMLLFIIAYFFYIDGVGTVISMSTAFGTQIGLGQTSMIFALLLTQIVAFPFAILYGRLAEKIGSITMITIGAFIYLIICVLGFYMGYGLENKTLSIHSAEIIFWTVAVLVGTSQGGIQSISRSYFGKIVNPKNAGEFFGFFDIFGKFASVIGPCLYASIVGITGRSSFGILSLIVLFAVGLAILIIFRKELISAAHTNSVKAESM